MTLDEAIDHAREKACGTDACADDHRQLAAWLEELRDLRVYLDLTIKESSDQRSSR